MIETPNGPVPVVDADSHLLEPADLWTSRVPARFKDKVPHVELNPDTGHHHWRIGDKWIWPVGYFGNAGFAEYPPLFPWEYEDVQLSTYDAQARLKRLDEYGVDIQILYPNIIGFQAPLFFDLGPELSLMCTRAYNDFAMEWCAADPHRLTPIAMLPYWDLEASVAEMERCAALGFRGVLFSNVFERVGLPSYVDPYWDPIYARAQELDMPINFHIGFSTDEASSLLSADAVAAGEKRGIDSRSQKAMWAGLLLLKSCDKLGILLTSDLCARFPRLKLVSIESGFGHIPLFLESLDWHWKSYGVPTTDLLPSEYFKRQCYGTFWFERGTLKLLEQYADNFMFSTDYPHGTSASPGPCSPAVFADTYIKEAFEGIPTDVMTKAIWGNANSLYKFA